MTRQITITTTHAAKVLEMDLGTLRLWDKMRCLPLHQRPSGRWRKFSFEDLFRVAVVERMVRMGLPICFACDRFTECVHPLTVEDFLQTPNASIGIAYFRENRNLLAVKYMAGPLPDSLIQADYWASRPAWSTEMVDGSPRPIHWGNVETLADPKPEVVSVINLNAIIERIQDRLETLQEKEPTE